MDVLATLDVATAPEMMAQIRESERQLARGEGMSIADLEAQLARDAAQPRRLARLSWGETGAEAEVRHGVLSTAPQAQ